MCYTVFSDFTAKTAMLLDNILNTHAYDMAGRHICKKYKFSKSKCQIWQTGRNDFWVVWEYNKHFYGLQSPNMSYQLANDLKDKLEQYELDNTGLAF